MTENPYWLKFFNFIRPALILPSRYQISGPLLQEEYDRVKSSIMEQIAAADSVDLMCDGWSNVRNEAIINFVVTTPTPLLYKILPTGQQSHNEIESVIKDIGIGKVFGPVTDDAANMKAAWSILKTNINNAGSNLFTHGCFAHSFDLIFRDIKKLPNLQTFLAHTVSIINTTRISLVVRYYKQIEDEDHFKNVLPSCPLLEQEEIKVLQFIANRKESAISDVHRSCNLLDPSVRGRDLTADEQTDVTEQIFETARRIPEIDEKAVLTDIANFQAKDGFFIKHFLWLTVNDISPTAWWSGLCKSKELSKLATRFVQ